MRRLLVSTFVSLACVAPVLAQGAPQDRAAARNTAEDQDTLNQGVESIHRSVEARLALAGFTDIQMVPTSFLVRAKDRAGNPVMLMLSPDAIAEMKQIIEESGPPESPRSETPQPPAAPPRASDAE
jgi:hypothetical protein